MSAQLYLTDTTLRDGVQRPGLAFSPATRLRLMHTLDDAGIYQMDAGIPASGSHAKDILRRMMSERRKILLSTWNRMRPGDIRDSLDVEPDVIHISVPASDRLLCRVLGKSRVWAEDMLTRCISLARENGYPVTVGLQDASRADIPFLLRLAELARGMGVSMLKLSDTVGILTPMETRALIHRMLPCGLPLGLHSHNDLGLAVPVAIEAIRAGATHIDVTCFGIGERAGNCDLFALVQTVSPLLSQLPITADPQTLRQTIAALMRTAISLPRNPSAATPAKANAREELL